MIAVTHLKDSGPGNLRAAVEAEGPRIVVFQVSGTIQLEDDLDIRNPSITIAGQTAPGDGICLRDHMLSINADDVIIRYLRVRLGDETARDADAIGGRGHKNFILDHVSASWSIDETMSIRQQTAEEAYQIALEQARASLPQQDAIDRRIIEEVREGTARFAGGTYAEGRNLIDPGMKSGIIDSQSDVGGWPELKSRPAPADGDGDGMPDSWELRFGFDPRNASDGPQDYDNDGYTNIEEYLNGTNPKEFVDYTKPENNVNTLH